MSGRTEADITDFNDSLKSLPHQHKVLVPGNHEVLLGVKLSGRFGLGDDLVLINEGIEFGGPQVWGSLLGRAFGLSVVENREKLYAQISHGIDVLVSHGPPFWYP